MSCTVAVTDVQGYQVMLGVGLFNHDELNNVYLLEPINMNYMSSAAALAGLSTSAIFTHLNAMFHCSVYYKVGV